MFTRLVVSVLVSALVISAFSVVTAQAQSCKVIKDCPCIISKDAMRALRLALSSVSAEKEDAKKENRPVKPAPGVKFRELFNQLLSADEMVIIPKGTSVIKTIVSSGGWLSVDDVQLRPLGSRESCWALNESFLDCK